MSYSIQSYPILDALAGGGGTLHSETLEWMKKWKGMDLDDSAKYQFTELSGSTSINLRIQTVAADPKSRGSFVPRNGAANPNTEIAYFNMAAIVGWDKIYRPAARYELGPIASAAFKKLIDSTRITGTQRRENMKRILAAIATGSPLKGAVKAKKHKSAVALDSIATTGASPNGAPKSSHPIIAYLQAGSSMPVAGKEQVLKTGYKGDAYELAREYSVIMTLDSVFQQWDRYSGGNVVISNEKAGEAHFYTTDNGGADINKTSSWTERNLGWFSRYERSVITKLREIYDFLGNPSSGYLGYTDANEFIVDLGLYFELTPEVYVERIRRNIGLLLNKVQAVETKYGPKAYLE
jgi:hypothetical protein